MDGDAFIIAMTFVISTVATGVLCIVVAIPMWREKIAPNALYGFRTAKTLSDEKIWYAANKASASYLMFAGAVMAVLGAASYPLAAVLPIGWYIAVASAIFCLPLVWAAVASFRYLARL